MKTRTLLCVTLCCFALATACGEMRRHGLPPDAQQTIETAIRDIDNGRYDKLYQEAADEWRKDATLEASNATLRTLREKLGTVRSRNQQSAREEQTPTGHSLVVIYETHFERGSAMETFTLLERQGHWYLARYFVSSSQLK